MTAKDVILKASNISKTYSLGAARIEVLKGVSISVTPGEFIAITGASGSGKSTLLHILGALDLADKGHVEFEGRRLGEMTGAWLDRYRNRSVGFVFQFYHLLDELSVLENAMLPAMAATGVLGWLNVRKNVRKRAADLLERLGLADRLKHRPWQLSGGERQRVAIARALMNQPKLLLADEPTGNLDSETGNGILEVFGELNRAGQTIIMVTHDNRIAQKAGKTVRLADGRIL
jgi:lipoprotein-releasing system ATP-binding protein